MSRHIRRVPADWAHPTDDNGDYVPLLAAFTYNADEIQEGLRNGWLTDAPPHYGIAMMPQWPPHTRTCFQLYETTTEGTPLSPVMTSLEALEEWAGGVMFEVV